MVQDCGHQLVDSLFTQVWFYPSRPKLYLVTGFQLITRQLCGEWLTTFISSPPERGPEGTGGDGREGGREGRKGGREGGREGGRKGGREGRKKKKEKKETRKEEGRKQNKGRYTVEPPLSGLRTYGTSFYRALSVATQN